MKKMSIYLNGIKSRCFVLLTCLSLVFATTSCNNDDFDFNEPEQQKQYTKAELIEQALSRMPRMRAEGNGVMMITIKDTVNIKVRASEEMTITWGDHSTPGLIEGGEETIRPHIYTDGYPSHTIFLYGSAEVLQSLVIDNQELILLEVYSNENLTNLSCRNNHLDAIDLSGCKKLGALDISNNEFTSIDLTCLPELLLFHAVNNWLMELNLSTNSNLFELYIENNQIRELDLSKNPTLYMLEAQNNPLKILKLKNEILGYMDISYTQITDLDLRECKDLWAIILEGTPIERINNEIISDTSFISLTELQQLNIAYTSSFSGLNLSVNPNVILVDISGASITRLDISEGQIMYLYATRSKLTDLIWGKNGLSNLFEIRIENTPFEKDSTKISKFVSDLPLRSCPGHLYTYSRYINDFVDAASSKNWLINQ